MNNAGHAHAAVVEPLQVRGVVKSFGAVHAVKNVTLAMKESTVHAVVGENGAGKSTLAKILAGEILADSGQVQIHGSGPNPRSPRDAARRGVGMVHQEFLLAADLTVWENVILGWEHSHLLVSEREGMRLVREVAELYKLPVPLMTKVGDLPIALQQRVEIVKALYRGADILILDEPTAVLTPLEAQGLFEAMDRLRSQGKTLVFVSHKLKEVLHVADTITVMRAGEVVSTVSPAEVTEQELASLIIGREIEPVHRNRVTAGPLVVEARDVRSLPEEGSTGLQGCSFSVRAGEVVGIAGVSGNGQDELVEILCGHRTPNQGQIEFLGLSGGPITLNSTTRSRATAGILRDAGLSYVPADRASTGSAPGEPLWFSAIPGRRRPRWPWSSMYSRRAREDADRIRQEFAVRSDSAFDLPAQLSGGNLQKFIVGRELSRNPQLLVAYEPTRGIDIGSARLLRQRLRELAERGVGVILVSSDLDELLETSDRLLVLSSGVISAEFGPESASAADIGMAMTSRMNFAREE